jgi:phosphoglycerate dehydrogenase-like enzyme
MKIVMSGRATDQFVDELRATFPDVIFHRAATPEEEIELIRDADVYCGEPSREVFLAAQRLLWIQCPGTGIDRIVSIPEIRESDVILTNARGPHTNPMADHAFGMILTFAHCLREQWEDQKVHYWDTGKYDERVLELSGSTLGILALGGIGMAVARRGYGFGMEVYAVDTQSVSTPPEVKAVWGLDRLDELLQMSDWFVITAPFTPETEGLIDHRRIGLLKPGAHVIAISRGGILDEEALIDGLNSGRIAGAGLDVMAVEPLPADSPLWNMDNVILSPHASALTAEMWEGRRQIFKENLRRFLAGEPFLYVCDKQAGF